MTTYTHTFNFSLAELVLYVVLLVLLFKIAYHSGKISGIGYGWGLAKDFYATALERMTQVSAEEEETQTTEGTPDETR